MKLDPAKLPIRDAHRLMVGCVVPRPIAWVSTITDNGVFNLAPFSFYGIMSSQPAIVGFNVTSRRDGKKKDTLVNVEATKEFVIAVLDETLVEKMVITAEHYPRDVSEFTKAGLTQVKADLVKPCLVGESVVNMECREIQILEFGQPPRKSSWIIGEVLRVHIKDGYFVNGDILVDKVRPIARLGGEMYSYTREMFTIPLPEDSVLKDIPDAGQNGEHK